MIELMATLPDNADLIGQCIEGKRRHCSVKLRIVAYHQIPLLIESHAMERATPWNERGDGHTKAKKRNLKIFVRCHTEYIHKGKIPYHSFPELSFGVWQGKH